MSTNLPKYISFAQLREAYGIARSTAYRLIAESGMPKPFKFGTQSVKFDRDEIEEWLASRPRSECQGGNNGVAP